MLSVEHLKQHIGRSVEFVENDLKMFGTVVGADYRPRQGAKDGEYLLIQANIPCTDATKFKKRTFYRTQEEVTFVPST